VLCPLGILAFRSSSVRAERLLRLLSGSSHPLPALRPVKVVLSEPRALAAALAGSQAVLSALPPGAGPGAARAALAVRAHYCDLGGAAGALDDPAVAGEARTLGVSVVPGCGLAPGLVQALAVFAMSRLPRARHVRILCGTLPQTSRPPFDERLALAAAGLLGRGGGMAVCLREGLITELPALTELELVDFPRPVGRCEAFLSAGGAASAPRTFAGTLQTYELKTVAVPGTFARIRALADLGFLDERPVAVDGASVAPRAMTQVLLEERTGAPAPPDLVVARVECTGESGTSEAASSYRIDFLATPDSVTGFSALERAAGSAAAIVSAMQAAGEIPPGAAPIETAVPADRFMAHLARREFKIVHAKH
jgi:lysine 6-dehydrogenase